MCAQYVARPLVPDDALLEVASPSAAALHRRRTPCRRVRAPARSGRYCASALKRSSICWFIVSSTSTFAREISSTFTSDITDSVRKVSATRPRKSGLSCSSALNAFKRARAGCRRRRCRRCESRSGFRLQAPGLRCCAVAACVASNNAAIQRAMAMSDSLPGASACRTAMN